MQVGWFKQEIDPVTIDRETCSGAVWSLVRHVSSHTKVMPSPSGIPSGSNQTATSATMVSGFAHDDVNTNDITTILATTEIVLLRIRLYEPECVP